MARFVLPGVGKPENDTVSELMTTEGENVQMWCPGNTENGDVRWWRENESGKRVRLLVHGDVVPEFEDRMTFDTTTSILTINDSRLTDSGFYWCLVGFESSVKLRLSVVGKSPGDY